MTLLDSVRGLVCENFGVCPEAVTSNTALTALTAIDGDGLDVLGLLCGIQIEFGIDIDEDEFDELATVGDLVAVVKFKLEASEAA